MTMLEKYGRSLHLQIHVIQLLLLIVCFGLLAHNSEMSLYKNYIAEEFS